MDGCKQDLKGTRQKKTGQLDGKKSTKGYSRQLAGIAFTELWLWFNPNHLQYCIQMIIRYVFLHVGKNGS